MFVFPVLPVRLHCHHHIHSCPLHLSLVPMVSGRKKNSYHPPQQQHAIIFPQLSSMTPTIQTTTTTTTHTTAHSTSHLWNFSAFNIVSRQHHVEKFFSGCRVNSRQAGLSMSVLSCFGSCHFDDPAWAPFDHDNITGSHTT